MGMLARSIVVIVAMALVCVTTANEARGLGEPVGLAPAVRFGMDSSSSVQTGKQHGSSSFGTGGGVTGAGHSDSSFHTQACSYCVPVNTFPPYGEPSGNDFPSSVERTTQVWVNMVRMDPIYFRNTWMSGFMFGSDTSYSNILQVGSYPAKAPLRWNLNLNRVARAHSTDRQTCASNAGGSPHNDCNSTTFGTRFNAWYSGGGGEIFW
jgi:hypothetical protein